MAPAVPGATQAVASNPYVHYVRVGDSIDLLGQSYYGNPHYGRVIELVNSLGKREKLKPGTKLRTPRLDAILAEEGVSALFPMETHAMLEARASFMEVEDQLYSLARTADNGYVQVPEDVQLKLQAASQMMWDVAMGFRVPKPEVEVVPNRSIGQLKGVSFDLRRISYGSLDEQGFDLDVVHQKIAWAICNEIIWARNGYRAYQ